MEKTYSISYKGLRVHVVEARSDTIHDVQISVLGLGFIIEKGGQ